MLDGCTTVKFTFAVCVLSVISAVTSALPATRGACHIMATFGAAEVGLPALAFQDDSLLAVRVTRSPTPTTVRVLGVLSGASSWVLVVISSFDGGAIHLMSR